MTEDYSVLLVFLSEREMPMTGESRIVTASLPAGLAVRMDEVARRSDRSRSWIVRQALAEWLAEDQRRHDLTLEAVKDVDEGRTFSHAEVTEHFARRRATRERRPVGH
jgi:predicted transcriptional regulator